MKTIRFIPHLYTAGRVFQIETQTKLRSRKQPQSGNIQALDFIGSKTEAFGQVLSV